MQTESFLGSGWGFPPQFSAGGQDLEMVSGEKDILQSLEIILSTRLQERVMRANFGCNLDQFLFEEIGQGLVTSIRGAVQDAILNHEPRVELDNVAVEDSDEQQGLILVSIRYLVRATNNRFNMVYPFYLNEATKPIT
ncbi:MAG TPA: hypothetical protein ENJ82_01565 [Bacteroidetes bacterium]|nr:hypothetical protein [Bacteroidota bacterium]